ncbi:MAG: hypothetical protein MUF31_00290 [Akkermansiaceae bacterium]|jgi:hypothetical protein|nr:hypothetical protein [Akkermansiaceae bacterium]
MMTPSSDDRAMGALLAFFDHYGADVMGHSDSTPDPAAQAEIERFASGEMPADQWDAFFARMADRPEWLGLLAGLLKKS